MTPRSSLLPMRHLNRVLAALAVVALLGVLVLLSWLRRQTINDQERDVRDLQQSFVAEQLLHGPGGDSLARFGLADSLVRRGLNSPYIAEAVVSLTLEDRPEIFLVPFTYANDHPGDPHVALAAYTPYPLGDPAKPFGRLYLKLDGTIVQRINWAIGATALAVMLSLFALLARVWSQESSLARTTIELNERRRELIRLERLALAGQISAGLLHDLRKPVLNIRHGLEEMHEALGDFAPAAAPLQELQENTHLFFEMLGEARIERFVRSDQVGEEFVDVGPVIDYSFNLVRYEQRGVTVERHQERNLPPVYAHPFKMIQLFSNLILNAYQAMSGHGKLTIELGRADGGVLARVTDTGPGIAPENQKRIFEPFFSTKAEGEGTGLGLSICRLILDEMGGRIHVESRIGGPTAFVVWLPSEGDAAPKEPQA